MLIQSLFPGFFKKPPVETSVEHFTIFTSPQVQISFDFVSPFQVERDSHLYRDKVVELRDQLSEATAQLDGMAGEYVEVRGKNKLKKHPPKHGTWFF